ncbi:MAG: hypothetical protein JWQ01_640 [Massilia sp.]|nr:hypothetical protein [Massilia sp.]
MDGNDFVHLAERDAIVIVAIRHALSAMESTNGRVVRLEGVRGILHYDPQMQKLKMALHLMGVSAMDHSESLIGG